MHGVWIPNHRKRILEWSHKLGSFPCPECEYVGKSKRLLYMHNRRCHKHMKINFPCQMCGIKTNSYDGLRSHRIFVHENNSNIECPQCESKFNTISHLKDHIAAVHDRVKKFACENCPYKATTQHRLGIHLKNHLKKTKRIWITLQVLPVVLVLVDGLCMCILAEPLPLRLLFEKLWNHANSKYNVCRHNQLWPFWFVNSHSSYIGMILPHPCFCSWLWGDRRATSR